MTKPVLKALPAQLRAVNDMQRTITFVASSEATDRYGDIVRVAGWNLSNYVKNPVFLWGHRSGDPAIGRTVQITKEVSPPALVQSVRFAGPDVYPFADTIYKLYSGGYLRAVSVGFMPTESQPIINEESGDMTGEEFTAQELFELSAVCVPANPEALARAVTKGVITMGEFDVMVKSGLEYIKRCGDVNTPWANSVPGVTFTDPDDASSGGSAGAVAPEIKSFDMALVAEVTAVGYRSPECTTGFCPNGRAPELTECFVRMKDGTEIVVSLEQLSIVEKAVFAKPLAIDDLHVIKTQLESVHADCSKHINDCPEGKDCPNTGTQPDDCPLQEDCPMSDDAKAAASLGIPKSGPPKSAVLGAKLDTFCDEGRTLAKAVEEKLAKILTRFDEVLNACDALAVKINDLRDNAGVAAVPEVPTLTVSLKDQEPVKEPEPEKKAPEPKAEEPLTIHLFDQPESSIRLQ